MHLCQVASIVESWLSSSPSWIVTRELGVKCMWCGTKLVLVLRAANPTALAPSMTPERHVKPGLMQGSLHLSPSLCQSLSWHQTLHLQPLPPRSTLVGAIAADQTVG